MKKFSAVMFALLCTITTQVFAGPPDGWPFVRYEDGVSLAKQNNKPMFILFGQHPCPFCDELKEKTFTNTRLKELYSKEYVLVYMDSKGANEEADHVLPDGTRLSHKEFIRKHKAFVTPTWVYYDAEGNKVFQGAGSTESAQNFVNFHKYVSGQYFKTMTYNDFLAKNDLNKQ